MAYYISIILCFLSFNLRAVFPVSDWPNQLVNLAHVWKTVQQIEQTKNRIAQQINSAQRFIENLKGYEFSGVNHLLRDMRSFRYRVRSIGYAYKNVAHQFEKIYGTTEHYAKNYQAWEQQSDDAIKEAMQLQGLVDNSEKHMLDLNQAINSKNIATTEAETLQAIGEIHAVQTKQFNDLKRIIATDARAKHSVLMETRAKEKLQKQYEEHLMSDFNDEKVAKPLIYFPSLGSVAPKVSR